LPAEWAGFWYGKTLLMANGIFFWADTNTRRSSPLSYIVTNILKNALTDHIKVFNFLVSIPLYLQPLETLVKNVSL
jgi:hypothetical protein